MRAVSKEVLPIFQQFDLSLTGQLVSGKNQVQLLFRHGKVHKYPNAGFVNWRSKANLEIHAQLMRAPNITIPVRLTCDYWPGDKRTRDVCWRNMMRFAVFHAAGYSVRSQWITVNRFSE